MNKWRLFGLFLAIPIFMVSLTQCVSTKAKTGEEELPYESISQYIALGEPEKAVEAYEQAVREKEDVAILKVLYARLLLLAGRDMDAEKELLEVIEEENENLDALYSLAITYGIQGNKEKQKETLLSILKIDEAYVPALSYLGELSLEENNTSKAAEYFNKALDKDPENFISLIGLAHTMMRKREYEKAVALYDRAIAIDPGYHFAYIDRATAKKRLKDTTGALDDLTLAIEKEPDYYWSYIDRGNLYLKTGKMSQAVEDFSRAISVDPDYFIAYVYRGGIYYRQKNWEAVKEDYEKVYTLKPGYFYVYEPLGIIYYREGNWDKAYTMFKKAYDYNRNEPSYLLLAAICLKKENKKTEVKDFLSDNWSAFPRDTWYYEVARFYLFPNNDFNVMQKQKEEKNRITKKQILFYISVQYLFNGENNTARTLLLEVINLERKDLLEYDLARWELEKLGVTLDW